MDKLRKTSASPKMKRDPPPRSPARRTGTKTARNKIEPFPHESERQILDAMPAGFVLLDLEGNFRFVNRHFEELSGYSREELIGRPFYVLSPEAPEEEKKRFSQFLKSAPRQGRLEPMDAPLLFRDGQRQIPLSCNVSLLRDERGRKRAVIVLCLDVTDRLSADKTLRENEERFRALFEGSLDAIFLLDPATGRILEANPSASELLLLPTEKIIGQHHSSLAPPGQRANARERFREFFLDRDPLKPVEMKVVRSDGREKDVEVLAQIIQIDGKPVLYALFRDITERRKAEEALRESEELYRTLVKTLPDAVTVTDLEGRIIEVSQQTIELHGFRSAGELMGKNAVELIHPKDRDQAHGNLQKAFESGLIRNREYSFLKKDGSTILGELNTALVRDARGNPKSFVTTLRDLTERKRIEEELARSQRLESLGVLAGGIAHDFNNILSAISMNLSMARMYGNLETDTDKMLVDAETATSRAKGLTQQLLSFAKGYSPVKKTLSAAKLLYETVRFSLTGSNVRCQYSLPEDLWPVEVDEGQISQAIQNLVINADQSMPEGGTIRVRAENVAPPGDLEQFLKKGKYVRISISDQGIGIPRKHLHKIFDPFFTTKQKGSGFGLTTCYTIINKHGGHIQVESEVGAGTTFHIYLPASEHALKTEQEQRPELHRGEGRILLVDDEAIVRGATGEALRRMGYRVETAEEGGQGVELYKEALEWGDPFTAVILDLTIPGGMGGKEAVRKILEVDPQAAVIVSSGYSSSSVMSRFREHGFSGVVKKPYRIEELGEVITGALKRRKGPP